MDFHSVLVESQDSNGNSVYGNSGILLGDDYVITTFNSIVPFVSKFYLENVVNEDRRGIIVDNNSGTNTISFFIIRKKGGTYFRSQKAHMFGYFCSKNIRHSSKYIFRNWSIDSLENHNFNLLSFFIILKLEGSKHEFENSISSWFQQMSKVPLMKGQNLKCISTGFGNRHFLNHFSMGIVSNIMGKDDCIVFSDLPLTPGSEGSPVFLEKCKVPIGIVISAINWWKSEWLNFTVIADLRALFVELLSSSRYLEEYTRTILDVNFKLLSAVESSIFQIYNGTIWGTAVLINKEKGILITNAHVVGVNNDIILQRKNKALECNVLFTSPENHVMDIAILKVKTELGLDCQEIRFSRNLLRQGDPVYAAGFPIFSKDTNAGPTLTKGHISHLHPQMVKTTCSIYPGASGGAVLDEEGGLFAIIVSNARISEGIDMVYPKMNMSIPIALLEPIIERYIADEDVATLADIALVEDQIWRFSCKL